jgi:peptidoglycan/LPS O-acetylase OafA/YrhL
MEAMNISSSKKPSLSWLDLTKSIAIVWVVLNHLVERVFGYPYVANPNQDWPSFAERLAQLRPLEGFGFLNAPINLVRYLGWLGDQGVTLFIIASGFGLTWGLLKRGETSSLRGSSFLRRRAERIYPPWWAVHLIFLGSALIVGWGLSPTDIRTYLSFAGVRFTPELFYYFSPAWWYVGLIIQLYLVFPLLWKGLQKLGPARLLVFGALLCFISRSLGFLFFDSYLDAWQRGAVFITRLAEFVFGMSFAAWLQADPNQFRKRLKTPGFIGLVVFVYILGLTLSMSLPGMVLAPALLGASLFILAYLVLESDKLGRLKKSALFIWPGKHSYSLYLLHHPLILLLVPASSSHGAKRIALGIIGAVLLGGILAALLDKALPCFQNVISRAKKKWGLLRVIFAIIGAALLVMAGLISGELLVRRASPQEILGWGERPSLEPDGRFGWKLKPSQTIRLRWESYDYEVTSNSLGFPGPEYALQKPEGAYRIMVTGDAFTSAEGVDTESAWPRLLEKELSRLQPRKIEVLNFAITGYGPNQYARVVQEFAPEYLPDLILIGFFVNEFQDVLKTDQQFARSIGFELPPQNSLSSVMGLMHLRRCLDLHLNEPLRQLITGKPRPHGYFLGNFAFLEKGRDDLQTEGRREVAARLMAIKAVADRVGARLAIMMIPAPVQVCGPERLDYYPRHINLKDAARYDQDLPQRMTAEICRDSGIAGYDLRGAFLDQNVACPYQRKNMHWTEDGHRLAAEYLSAVLIRDKYLD